MKKTVIIAIIAVVIIGVVFVNFNKEKTSITSSDFYSIMTQKGYSVQDASSQFLDYNYVKQVYIATTKDYSYQIEFYELLNDSYATSFFNSSKSIFASSKGNASAETSVGLKNYSEYTLSSNGKYMLVSRIDNTVVYVNVDNKYKDTVKTVLNELGYISKSNFNIVFPAIFVLVGSIFFIIGIVMFKKIKKKEKNCTSKTYGKVKDIVRHQSYDIDGGHSSSLYPVFEYNIGELKFIKESEHGSSKSKYEIGQNVEVYYNPEDYNEYYIAGDTAPKTAATIFTIMGVGAIIIAISSTILML